MIVNYHTQSCDVFVCMTGVCGPDGTEQHFGNPFNHFGHSTIKHVVQTREEAVACYEVWLLGEAFEDVEPKRRQWILDNLYRLKNKTLGDWSYPEPSHAAVLERLANEQ